MPRLEFLPEVEGQLANLGSRDLLVIRENIETLVGDPRDGSHPSGLSIARPLAWQHVCPHSFVVVFRWEGCDPTSPPETITIERIAARL